MNYKQFFDKILLEAAPTHEIPDDAIDGILDDDTDPTQFKKDVSVEGNPKSSIDDAKALWDTETEIPEGDYESKKESISKVERFLAKLDTFVKNLKNLPPEKKYTSIAILADLVSIDPEMSQKYNGIKGKLEKMKQAEDLRRQASELDREATSGDEQPVMATGSSTPAHAPLPNPQV